MIVTRSRSVGWIADFGGNNRTRKRNSYTDIASTTRPQFLRPRSMGNDSPLTVSSSWTSKMLPIVEKAANQMKNYSRGNINSAFVNDLNNVNQSKRISSSSSTCYGDTLELSQMARDGDIEGLTTFLDNLGSSAPNYLNQLSEDRLSPLHYAVRYNHLAAVKLLVEHGAIVHIRGEDGQTPLHYAAKYNCSKRRKKKSDNILSDSEGKSKPNSGDSKEFVESRQKEATTKRTHKTINKKVKNIGSSLQKLKNRKFVKSSSLEEVWKDGVVLTGIDSADVTLSSEPLNEDDIVLYLVSQMAEVNCKDDYSLTPLHYAAMKGNRPVAKSLLLCHGVNIEARDSEEMTPLHLAAIHNNSRIALLLIKAGAQLRCRDENLATPLHHAASEGNLEIIKMLITAAEERGEWESLNDMVNDKDFEKAMPLHNAVENGHQDCADYLISKGADVNTPKQNMLHLLHLAAKNGDIDTIRLLLNSSKNINCLNNFGETPLHEAVKHNHVGVIDILVQNGADLEFQNNSGFTPLITAAYYGHVEAIESLVSLGAVLHATDFEGKTAIYWATAQNQHDALMSLLDESPRSQDLVKRTDRYGNSPLHVATLKGYTVITRCLLDLGAPIELRNDMEQTPMHLAAWHGRTKIVKDLLWRNKTVINYTDEDGNTPLHVASLVGNESVVKLLIEAGASLDIRNSRMWTSLDCAASRGFVSIVKLLLESGCLIDPIEKMRVSPLHLAAATGTVEVVNLLLENGADITRRDDQLRNPLEIAIDNSRKDIARAIIASDQWENVLHYGTLDENGLKKTPLRKLVIKMPDVAEDVFQRCTTTNCFPSDHPLYTVTFNYEFIDDTFVQWEEIDKDAESLDSSKVSDSFQSDKKSLEPQPSNVMIKKNHPLMLMVKSKRVHLLAHPLCISLLHLKWKNFGRFVYYTNFILYLLFLFFLTGYILASTPPLSPPEKNDTNTSTSMEMKDNDTENNLLDICPHVTTDIPTSESLFLKSGKYIIIVLASFHIIKEFLQMYMMRWNYLGLENLIEWICFTTSLLLTIDFTECSSLTGVREIWQWEIGTIAIFMAWVNLVMFVSKFPFLGLYVVMFGDVIRTFCKVCSVFFLFIVAFAMGFYTVFYYNPSYDNGAKSIVRVVVMMLGEFQFDDFFAPDTLQHPAPAYFLFFIFMFLISIITTNLLVGLAVDDIKTVKAQANLKRLAMQVKLVLDVESVMPKFLQQRFVIKEQSFMPNRLNKGLWRGMLTKINSTQPLIKALKSPEKFREATSSVYRCKMSEINKVIEQQEKLHDNNKEIENTIYYLQIEHKKLHKMLTTLLVHHGVELTEETNEGH
ncbi:hypothetical protein CHUAL_013153 [Chamberlinius hualienensis]